LFLNFPKFPPRQEEKMTFNKKRTKIHTNTRQKIIFRLCVVYTCSTRVRAARLSGNCAPT